MNDPDAESGENTLHQITQLLENGMSTVKMAVPSESKGVPMNCPSEASGSSETTMGEPKFADSA